MNPNLISDIGITPHCCSEVKEYAHAKEIKREKSLNPHNGHLSLLGRKKNISVLKESLQLYSTYRNSKSVNEKMGGGLVG